MKARRISGRGMLLREGDARDDIIDLRLAALLAGIAGAVNSAGFHALGFFSANMTGNASALSDFLALGRLDLAWLFLLLICAFILGAFFASVLIDIGRRAATAGIYALMVAVEGSALTGLGLVDLRFELFGGATLLVAGLSFLMGFQNATTTRITNSRVRTTHISGIATDIGVGIATLARRTGGMERTLVIARLKLHLTTVVAFILGGLAGVLLYQGTGGLLLVIAGLLLLAVALPELVRARRSRE